MTTATRPPRSNSPFVMPAVWALRAKCPRVYCWTIDAAVCLARAVDSEDHGLPQYVFDTRQAIRYRFPTHTNDLIMDRRDAAASEAFFVSLEPGDAPPLHVHD